MKAVYKYALVPGDQIITMPAGSTPLHVAEQHGKLQLWVLVPVDSMTKGVKRAVRVVGTGHAEIPDTLSSDAYVGTALCFDGHLALHVFMSPHEGKDA